MAWQLRGLCNATAAHGAWPFVMRTSSPIASSLCSSPSSLFDAACSKIAEVRLTTVRFLPSAPHPRSPVLTPALPKSSERTSEGPDRGSKCTTVSQLYLDLGGHPLLIYYALHQVLMLFAPRGAKGDRLCPLHHDVHSLEGFINAFPNVGHDRHHVFMAPGHARDGGDQQVVVVLSITTGGQKQRAPPIAPGQQRPVARQERCHRPAACRSAHPFPQACSPDQGWSSSKLRSLAPDCCSPP